jgi:hypothetical protein
LAKVSWQTTFWVESSAAQNGLLVLDLLAFTGMLTSSANSKSQHFYSLARVIARALQATDFSILSHTGSAQTFGQVSFLTSL